MNGKAPDPKGELAICMGSSCHPRGNGANLETIRAFLGAQGLSGSVSVVGHRCENHCESGPNIRVRGRIHHDISPDRLPAFLQEVLPQLQPGEKGP